MTKTSCLTQVITSSNLNTDKIHPGCLKSIKIRKGKHNSKLSATKTNLKGISSESSNYHKINASTNEQSQASQKRNETPEGAKLFLLLQKLTPATSVFENMMKKNKIQAWALKLKKQKNLVE